jgi:HSP20 family protein
MDRFVDEAFRGSLGLVDRGGSRATAIRPRINVSETDQEIRIEAEMPGFPAENVQVEVIDDALTTRGEQREEHEEDRGENYHVVQRVYGTFVRAIQLPFAVKPEQIQASFQNGVLTVTVPKSAAASKVHRVQIGGGSVESQSAGSAGFDRAAAGNKPTSAAGAGRAAETTQQQSGGSSNAEPGEGDKKNKAAQ